MASQNKSTHFGRAAEFFAMSELLLRGWNVAVPVVDIGDDVLIIDDNDKTTFRLQVKSTEVTMTTSDPVASFGLSRKQLGGPALQIELIYMLLARYQGRWTFFVIPRAELHSIHHNYLQGDHSGPGRPPKSDDAATSDTLKIQIDLETCQGWRESLAKYRGSWPEMLPELSDGPGTRSRASVSSAR